MTMREKNMLEALSDNIVVDMDKCTFCGVCVETCILDNLRMALAPCRQACPLGVNCQGYVQLILRGQNEEALAVLRETLPFPGILARVCSHPCEDQCHRKETTGQAVAIRALKRYLVESSTSAEPPLPDMQDDTKYKVAILGSGPAGMTAAYDLRQRGHQVTIFDKESEPGGMLRWAIPEFRLPTDILKQEVGLLERMGVKIECGKKLGQDITLDGLKNEYDAVVLAMGAGKAMPLKIEGSGLAGIFSGLSILKEVRNGNTTQLSGAVVVIGGGNSAVDAAQTALRLGADAVTVIALETENELPAFEHAVSEARAEGVAFECGWGPLRFLENSGRVSGIKLNRCLSVLNQNGEFSPCFDNSQTMTVEADTVILAIGQTRDLSGIAGSPLAQSGGLQSDPLTLQTADEKIFAAGDLVSGPSSVVDAMAAGRRAAESVDRFLKGEHLAYGRAYPGPVETEFTIDTSRGAASYRIDPPVRAFTGLGDFKEIGGCLSDDAARTEASRCYSCGKPFGKYRTCWFCLPCEVECPHQALWVEVPYLLK
jgi:NADPH-dependent glutamate synthase beta subunit-like oxidoreductase